LYTITYPATLTYPTDPGAIRWIRFWPGGQVDEGMRDFSKDPRRTVTAADGDNFLYWGAGRYSIRGDTIVVQTITGAEDILCAIHFSTEKGHVNSDGSFTITERDGFAVNNAYTFYPTDVGKMTREPDWQVK